MAAPETSSAVCCVPRVAPPIVNSLEAVDCNVRFPVTARMPVGLPGATTPPAVTVDAAMVPVPTIFPVPTSSGLANDRFPPATLRVPPLLVKEPGNESVPAVTSTVPALVSGRLNESVPVVVDLRRVAPA